MPAHMCRRESKHVHSFVYRIDTGADALAIMSLTSNHHISGAHDAIRQGVAAAIHVVKLGLCDGVVDVDGGEQQAANLLRT